MNFDPSLEKPILGCDSRTSTPSPFSRFCIGQRVELLVFVSVCLSISISEGLCQFVSDSETPSHPHRGTTQTPHTHKVSAYNSILCGHAAFYKIESGRTDDQMQFSRVRKCIRMYKEEPVY